jgi:hypothetical protein
VSKTTLLDPFGSVPTVLLGPGPIELSGFETPKPLFPELSNMDNMDTTTNITTEPPWGVQKHRFFMVLGVPPALNGRIGHSEAPFGRSETVVLAWDAPKSDETDMSESGKQGG